MIIAIVKSLSDRVNVLRFTDSMAVVKTANNYFKIKTLSS